MPGWQLSPWLQGWKTLHVSPAPRPACAGLGATISIATAISRPPRSVRPAGGLAAALEIGAFNIVHSFRWSAQRKLKEGRG
jgi:hypothetical protein